MSYFGAGYLGGSIGGNDSFTKVLLHLDGSNGGTTFIDSNLGGAAKTWTPTNATTSTASIKIGVSSMLTAAGYITTPDHSDFTIGSNDFTIDFWINFNSTSGFTFLCGQSDAAGNVDSQSFYLNRGTAGTITATFRTTTNILSMTGTAGLNGSSTWTHIAIVKNGTSGKLYINGVQDATLSLPNPMFNGSGAWSVGRAGALATSPSSCYFDEFRFSNGIARWTAGFTPFNLPYS